MISEEWSVHNKQNINTKPNPVDSEKKIILKGVKGVIKLCAQCK